MKDRYRARATRWGRRAPALTAATAILAFAAPGVAAAADRAVRFTADPSEEACSAFDPLDCSYFTARNGLIVAPDPAAPGAVAPTFINLADLPGGVTIDAVIHDDGTITVAEGDVTFPGVDTVRSNDLVGPVTVNARIVQTGAWTGTLDDATGAMSLTAPLSLRFKLTCVPANGLCGALTGDGNLGTWAVTPRNTAELSTGHAAAPIPPAAYGPDWVPPVAEDGTALDPDTGAVTLVDNKLELEHLDPADCVDPASAICNNAGLGGVVVGELNNAIGATWANGTPPTFTDTVPGAIDMRMAFVMDDALIDATPSAVDFGPQPLGTTSVARDVDLSSLTGADLTVLSVYTDGGDEADFWVANDGCRGTVSADEPCTLKVRFNPTDRGNRATALYADVTDPDDMDELVTVQIAALSGQGGEVPRGPAGAAGPTGDAGPKGDPGPAYAPPLPASIRRGKSRLRLSSRGTATVATIKCPEGTCRISRRSARLKIGKKTHKVAITGSRTIATGKSASVRISVPKSVRKALSRRGKGALTVKLVVGSSNGGELARTITVQLRAR